MDFHRFTAKIRNATDFSRIYLQKAIAILKKHRFVTKTVTACLIGSLALCYTLFSSGFAIGFRVRYAGSVIATVKSANVFNDAEKIVMEKTAGRADGSVLATPVFQPSLAAPTDFDTADTVAEAIIENTDEITEAFAIVIDGEEALFTAVEGLEDMIETARTRFEVANADNTSRFVTPPVIRTGYYLKSQLSDRQGVESFLASLEVKTVSVFQSDETVPYRTETVKTDTECVGYSKVTTAGVNGITRKTETVVFQNGRQTDRTVETKEIKAPVTEVVTVGSAIPVTTEQQRKTVKRAGFVFPLGNVSYKISAYFGDGRNHKGIDLCADAGTPIYAVADGTVISSKYDGNYGNCVVVDHGNGITTRYAHASVLCAAVGDKVEQGDVVALVGTTGQSTGNHLHFEVAINGNRVNPAPYIGL